MTSPQALGLEDRMAVAAWAADCAQRVLPIFEAAAPGDRRPHEAIGRTRAFARGEADVAEEIRRRFTPGAAGPAVGEPAAAAAAKAAGQAAAVAHMGAHALGAAAYAVKAVGLADGDVEGELAWQLDAASPDVRAALRQLPALGSDPAGPLGPGLLARGALGAAIRALQAGLAGD